MFYIFIYYIFKLYDGAEMAKCTVTGGAGFIGSHIVGELQHLGHEVVVLDDFSEGSLKNLKSLEGNVHVIRGSITDRAAVDKAVEGSEFIFHEAALVSVVESMRNPERTMLVNVEGSRNILEAGLENGTKKVIIASSAAVYGHSPPPLAETAEKNPLSPYGKSKLEMEKLALEYGEKGLGTVCLRYFNVYGPRQGSGSPYSGVISQFMDALLAGKPVVLYGDGTQTRDFIYVKDVARANILAMEKGKGCINIATGKPTSLNELLSVLADLVGALPQKEKRKEREGDIRDSCADVSKAQELLGFEAAYSLEKGLEETFKWKLALP